MHISYSWLSRARPSVGSTYLAYMALITLKQLFLTADAYPRRSLTAGLSLRPGEAEPGIKY